MSVWFYLLLGFLQGVTEFLPISSSGHLFLLKRFFNGEEIELSLILILHGATVLSILCVFFKDIKNSLWEFWQKKDFFFFYKIFLSLLPLLFVGLFLKNFVEQSFQKNTVAIGFFISGMLLFSLYFLKKGKKSLKEMSFLEAFLIGLAQALAVFPGVSRSACTLVVALYFGLSPRVAVFYSFLISFPAIIGPLFINLSLSSEKLFLNWQIFFSFLMAFVIGWISLQSLLKVVQWGRLQVFSFYLLPLSFFLFFFF